MNDLLCLGSKVARPAGDPVIKSRPHGNEGVAVLDRHIGPIPAMHTQHTQAQRVIARIHAQGHDRCGNRNLEAADQFDERFGRPGPLHPAAHVEERAFGPVQ